MQPVGVDPRGLSPGSCSLLYLLTLPRHDWPRPLVALVGLALLLGGCSLPSARANPALDDPPEALVRAYVDALDRGDCTEALRLRPNPGDYSRERCASIESMRLRTLPRLLSFGADQRTAEVAVQVAFERQGLVHEESGCYRLQRTHTAGWRITGFGACWNQTHAPLAPQAAGVEAHPRDAPSGAPASVHVAEVVGQQRETLLDPVPFSPPPDIAFEDSSWAGKSQPRSAPVKAPSSVQSWAATDPALTLPLGGGSRAYGSAAVLEQCWSEAERSGPTQGIQKPLPVDLDGPPAMAIQRAATALPPVPPRLRGSIRSVDLGGASGNTSSAKLVALTFDLCEQANERTGYQADIVNYLRQYQVPATFFAGGKWMKTHPRQAMQLMADPLFEVGNHAWSHGNMRVLTGAAMHRQITWTQAQYAQLREKLAARSCAHAAGSDEIARIPRYPTTFRFPYGTCNQASLDALASYGLAAIQWNVVTGDPVRGQSAAAIARQVLNGVESSSGSIVIAHANGRGWNTAEALPRFIPQLRERGYRFVTVSDLLQAGRAVIAQSCYEVRPGDNARYDRLFGEGTGE